MRKYSRFSVFLWTLVVSAAASQGQQLTVQAEPGKPVVLNRADLEALPHVRVNAADHGAARVEFEGVSLKSVLEKGGVSFAESMKGKKLATCLLVEAADGYRVVIALPEVDPAFTDKQIVVAFLRDGKPLAEKEGPYRLVIPDEKRMARWVRQVTTLRIVDVQ
jgi:hypothetical protein